MPKDASTPRRASALTRRGSSGSALQLAFSISQPGVLPICALLFAVVVSVFWPCLHHDFVNLDDNVYVYDNLHVRNGLTRQSILWAFSNLDAGFWHPLTWLSIMLDCQLFGMHPGGHHLTSLLLHAANTILVFLVFQRMTRMVWRSAFVALLFGLHPLHVESVAWAAERKDVRKHVLLDADLVGLCALR